MTNASSLDTAIFGGGCFWCCEAMFRRLAGVQSVTPGYAGGTTVNPSYQDVCTGETGHAEVIRVVYDPSAVSYDDLLTVFFRTHDPTTLNRQGADIGTQYRSIILTNSDAQKSSAEAFIAKLEAAHVFDSPVVTEVRPCTDFYEAEDYHKNYHELNRNQPYCRAVIDPKMEKFLKEFKDKIVRK
jgi:peptide-methionine (S)-S-oxide reductase